MPPSFGKPLAARERLDCLRLIRSENIGPVTYRKLLELHGSAGAALKAVPDLARRGGRGRPIRLCSLADARREMEALEQLGARLVVLGEPDYPARLATLEDAPPVLSLRGHAPLLGRPSVAIVGARNASTLGCRFAERLGAELAAAGIVVVSGLARGLDAAAHRGALGGALGSASSAGGTIAVMAGGVDVIYPPENTDLYHRIAGEGAVVSEMPPGEQPQARHFPRRNRIVAGLALGVVVVEAAPRSGSLITARLAADQGREVMAVPGSPLDSRAQGPNMLIKQGAALIEDAQDVLRVIEPLLARPLEEPEWSEYGGSPGGPLDESATDAARPRVVEALSASPVTVDELIRQCQLSPSVVAVVLLELELAGRLDRHPGNRVSLLDAAS